MCLFVCLNAIPRVRAKGVTLLFEAPGFLACGRITSGETLALGVAH